MNSSQPSIADQETLVAPARPAFDWIEVIAIPVAANIMETQPLMLLLLFVAVVIIGSSAPLPLGEIGITLLLLGLQEWAMFIRYRLRRGMGLLTANVLHVVGVVVAFGVAVFVNINIIDIPTLVVIAGLVIFSWKRGVDKARAELDEEHVITVFKIGLGIALSVLIMSALVSTGQLTDVVALLTYALPLFFLSGIIALSFTRVGMIRREYVRQGIPQAASTRGWLAALTFLWGVLVAGALTLETFSFPTLQIFLLPLWDILVTIAAIIIYAVLWIIASILQLIGYLFHFQPVSIKVPSSSTLHATSASQTASGVGQFPTWLLLLVQILLIAVLLLLLFWIVRAILRQIRLRLGQEGEEEVRETLSMRTLFRERRQERKAQSQPEVEVLLDTLDPDSARARYRELLQQMALRGKHLGRRSEETPMEYQKRLTALMKISSGDTVSDREMLADLTRAYINERYGERQDELQPYITHNAVSIWISRLAERLGGPS